MLSNILLKIFSGGFYRQHAGLFFFTFLVLVGAVEPSQLISYHYSLMLGIASSKVFLASVCVIWLLYYTKVFFYLLKEIDQPENAFLFFSATKFKTSLQIKGWLIVTFVNSLPIILYSIVTAIVAIKIGYYGNALLVLLFNATCSVALSFFIFRYSNRFIVIKNRFSLAFTLFKNKPIYTISPFYILNDFKAAYLITKGLSYLFIVGLFILFKNDATDIRVAAIAILASGTSHAFLVLEIRKFEEVYFKLLRNLPYSLLSRFTFVVIAYTVLLLPELIWLLVRFNSFDLVSLLFFLISIPVLFHCLLFVIGFNVELYLKSVFGIFIALFLLIMFKLLYLTVPVILIASFVIFNKKYYKFQ